jgi:hypothetical protein
MHCLSYYALVFCSTKSEIRAEQVLPCESEGELEGESRGGRPGGEMTQTMYAHVNKWKKKSVDTLPKRYNDVRMIAKEFETTVLNMIKREIVEYK